MADVGTPKPAVLFMCVHNAGRSQMAAGYLRAMAGERVEVRSAGSEPANALNPAVVEAMLEEGIDLGDQEPKLFDVQDAIASDVVVTMGCGDTCPYFPGKRYEDWVLDDPAGQDLDAVRTIRDQIKERVLALLEALGL